VATDRLKDVNYNFKVLIDTTQSASSSASYSTVTATQTTASAAPHERGNRQPISDFGWYISVRDSRLLFSLESIYDLVYREGYVEVSSLARLAVTAGYSKDEAIKSGSSNEQRAPAVYADTTLLHLQQAIEGKGQGDPLDPRRLVGRLLHAHTRPDLDKSTGRWWRK